MIFVNSIEHSLFTTIASDTAVYSLGAYVELNEPFNSDHNKCPWVGIYFNSANIDPFRVGSPNPWQSVYQFNVYVQGSSYDNAELARDELNTTLNAVMSAINSNKNLTSTVKILESLSVTPYQRSLVDEEYMFTDELSLRYSKFV